MGRGRSTQQDMYENATMKFVTFYDNNKVNKAHERYSRNKVRTPILDALRYPRA